VLMGTFKSLIAKCNIQKTHLQHAYEIYTSLQHQYEIFATFVTLDFCKPKLVHQGKQGELHCFVMIYVGEKARHQDSAMILSSRCHRQLS
jgi:hypothetical protein